MLRSHSYTITYPLSQKGFSLLELVAVLIITSVLAITVMPRFSLSDNNVQLARQWVVDGLRHSRELALASAQTNTDISMVVSAATLDVRANGISVHLPNVRYPLSLPQGITVSRGRGVVVFDSLGSSDPAIIDLTNGDITATVTLTGGGYVY